MNSVKHLAKTLKSMGVGFYDSEFSMASLNAPPPRYDSLNVPLDTFEIKDCYFTFYFVNSRLLQKYQRDENNDRMSQTRSDSSSILYIRS